ncbi:hypothetical protein EGR_04330 [Echinococcus granulosus]|uniref:Uncharacterized protein n=1 Tax=Echinococcus granulosus TaxID=6210 RepID=W6UIG5_ECHGR|nr:hypothetical protein EGR_04330 [Echinococcus granulosus]EUB60891.1 hypothetical protein EGR_04330 [Echinococcus granulosus]
MLNNQVVGESFYTVGWILHLHAFGWLPHQRQCQEKQPQSWVPSTTSTTIPMASHIAASPQTTVHSSPHISCIPTCCMPPPLSWFGHHELLAAG